MEETNETLSIKEKCKQAQKKFDFRLDCDKPIIVHIDGKNFSKLIKNKFKRPFDDKFMDMMDKTAQFVCQNVQGTKMAYVQSDEITLLIWKNSPDSEIFFGGRLCKLQSVIAALATSEFNKYFILNSAVGKDEYSYTSAFEIGKNIESMKMAQFDCKVWNVDTIDDAYLWVLFRNIDCVRNSKQQAAQTYLPSKCLENLNTDEQIEKLRVEKCLDWNNFSDAKRYGRIIIKDEVQYQNIFTNETDTRHVWKVFPGLDLTKEENREHLRDMVSKSQVIKN